MNTQTYYLVSPQKGLEGRCTHSLVQKMAFSFTVKGRNLSQNLAIYVEGKPGGTSVEFLQHL